MCECVRGVAEGEGGREMEEEVEKERGKKGEDTQRGKMLTSQ